MVLRKMITVFLVLAINGCASIPSGRMDEEQVRTFAAVYRQSKQGHADDKVKSPSVALRPDRTDELPYFPVYEPGRVHKVWVPPHVGAGGRDVLVAGHWVFLMVEPPHWYVETQDAGPIDIPLVLPAPPAKE